MPGSGVHVPALGPVYELGRGGEPGIQDIDGLGRLEADDRGGCNRAGRIDDNPYLGLALEVGDGEAGAFVGADAADLAELIGVVFPLGPGAIGGKEEVLLVDIAAGERYGVVVLAIDLERDIAILEIEGVEVIRLDVEMNGFPVEAGPWTRLNR
jgi:hypothetical protein